MTEADRAKMKAYVARLDDAHRTLRDEVEPDVAPARGLTEEEQDQALQAVIRGAWDILRTRDDFERVVRTPTPPAADFPAIWRRLNERYRQAHQTGRNVRGG
jgi:hypothetical protein